MKPSKNNGRPQGRPTFLPVTVQGMLNEEREHHALEQVEEGLLQSSVTFYFMINPYSFFKNMID